MMVKYTYLLIDFFTIIIPFIFSFHPKIQFQKKWASFFPAMAISAILFLVWDEVFTSWGVWGFNPTYLIGLNIGHLPLEEILFFVCVPYACVFTYFCFQKFGSNKIINERIALFITIILVGILLVIGILNFSNDYTASTFILLAVFLLWHHFISKSPYLPDFYFSYIILLIPFFMVNGVLTGTGLETQVVWYNDIENLGIRIGTIPVEDIFYGMLLILLNVTLFESLNKARTAPQ
ncbi:MAG: lycopene cyclase domain-containing protein [Cyclobacteriaceae bacterium]